MASRSLRPKTRWVWERPFDPRVPETRIFDLALGTAHPGPDVPSTCRVPALVSTTHASSDLEPPFPNQRYPSSSHEVHGTFFVDKVGERKNVVLRTANFGGRPTTNLRPSATNGRSTLEAAGRAFDRETYRPTQLTIVLFSKRAAAIRRIPDGLADKALYGPKGALIIFA